MVGTACASCRWLKPKHSYGDALTGECRRYPPQPTRTSRVEDWQEAHSYGRMYPETGKNDFCGEHAHKEDG